MAFCEKTALQEFIPDSRGAGTASLSARNIPAFLAPDGKWKLEVLQLQSTGSSTETPSGDVTAAPWCPGRVPHHFAKSGPGEIL